MRPLITTTLLALAALAAFPPSSAAAAGWAWPVRGEVITPYRNGGDPYAAGQHRGIDIAAPAGTAVEAASAGTVTFAGRAGSSGLTVNVRTDDGAFDVSYLHLSSVTARRGEHISAGQRVGAVGTTGTRSAQEPHLHFGVREAGSRHAYRDPLDFLPPPGPGPAPEPPALPVEVPLLPLTPVPVPVPAEAPRALPAPEAPPLPAAPPMPAPRGAAAAAPAPAPLGSELRVPALARPPESASHAAGAREPGSREAGARETARQRPAERIPAPVSGPARRASHLPRPAFAEPPAAPRPHAGPRRDPSGSDGGINPGWLAACVGLVVAALALGRPAGPVEAARRARATIGALARPLTGRP